MRKGCAEVKEMNDVQSWLMIKVNWLLSEIPLHKNEQTNGWTMVSLKIASLKQIQTIDCLLQRIIQCWRSLTWFIKWSTLLSYIWEIPNPNNQRDTSVWKQNGRNHNNNSTLLFIIFDRIYINLFLINFNWININLFLKYS